MTNRKRTKKLIQVWMEESLVKQLDGIASRDDISRSEAIIRACKDSLGEKQGTATSADIELLRKDMAESFKAVAHAIENQPIAVQEKAVPQLPEPEYEKTVFGLYRKKKGKD